MDITWRLPRTLPPSKSIPQSGQLAVACPTRSVGSSRRRAKPWARFLHTFLGRSDRLALTQEGGFRSLPPPVGGFCWPSDSEIRVSRASTWSRS